MKYSLYNLWYKINILNFIIFYFRILVKTPSSSTRTRSRTGVIMIITLIILLINTKVAQQITCVLSYRWGSHYTDLYTSKFHTAGSAITQICVLLYCWVSHCTLCTFIPLSLSQPLHRSVYFHNAESAIMITQICVLSSFILDSAITQICVLSYLWVSHYTVCILSYCWVSHCIDLCTFILLSQPLWLVDYTDLCTFKFHTGVSHYTDLCTFIPFSQPLHSMCTFILLSQPLHRFVYFQTTQSTITQQYCH